MNWIVKLFIKNYKDTSSPKVRGAYIKLGTAVGIICNLLLFAIKLAAGIISGSVSIIADAFNNLSDTGSSLITIIGYKISIKPADREHPYGHGRIEYMSGFIVAVLITLVGAELLKSSVKKIFKPEDIILGPLSIAMLVISILVKLWMAYFNRKLGKTISSGGLIATSRDSLNDSISTLGVLLALLITRFTGVNIDPYAGIVIAGFILFSGIDTAKKTMQPLLGEPADPELVKKIIDTVLSYEDFAGVHDIVVHNYGPGRIFASLHVEVPNNIDLVHCHEQIDLCERQVSQELGIELVIHMDPTVTDDQKVNKTRELIAEKIKQIDERLTIHDFRMVEGETLTNLIFDVVVPVSLKTKNSELIEKIDQSVKEIDPKYHCVVTVDTDFSNHN